MSGPDDDERSHSEYLAAHRDEQALDLLFYAVQAESKSVAARWARNLLPDWEAAYPGDYRPHRAIEVGEAAAGGAPKLDVAVRRALDRAVEEASRDIDPEDLDPFEIHTAAWAAAVPNAVDEWFSGPGAKYGPLPDPQGHFVLMAETSDGELLLPVPLADDHPARVEIRAAVAQAMADSKVAAEVAARVAHLTIPSWTDYGGPLDLNVPSEVEDLRWLSVYNLGTHLQEDALLHPNDLWSQILAVLHPNEENRTLEVAATLGRCDVLDRESLVMAQLPRGQRHVSTLIATARRLLDDLEPGIVDVMLVLADDATSAHGRWRGTLDELIRRATLLTAPTTTEM